MSDWTRIGFWISVVGGIIGIFGTVFGVWAFYQTRETKLISFDKVTRTVFSDPDYFHAKFYVEENDREDSSWFSETAIVIWNSGTTAVRDSDVRTPISIDMGKVGYIVAIRIVDAKSSIKNDFTVADFSSSDRFPQSATIQFKIFDPGMAVKVAILHQGGGAAMSISADLGPGFSI